MQGKLSNSYLSKIKTIFYHGSCADGIISREILKYAFYDIVRFVPYYFQELGTIPENALFIDCSPKDYQIEDCLKNGCLIAEHHESFEQSFIKFDDLYPNRMLLGYSSNAESGAKLAVTIVKQLMGDNALPLKAEIIADLISISDTWKKANPDFAFARMLAAYVEFFSNDFSENLNTLYDNKDLISSFGKVKRKEQEMYAETSIRVKEGNTNIAFINHYHISDAAEILRSKYNVDLVVGFTMKYEPNENRNIVLYSLRSKEEVFDCAKFAKKNGGGGHKPAAGFAVTCSPSFDPIMRFMDRFINYTEPTETI